MRRSPGDWIGLSLLHKRPRIALSGAPVARRAIRSAGAQAEAGHRHRLAIGARLRGGHRSVSAKSVKRMRRAHAGSLHRPATAVAAGASIA